MYSLVSIFLKDIILFVWVFGVMYLPCDVSVCRTEEGSVDRNWFMRNGEMVKIGGVSEITMEMVVYAIFRC